MVDGATASPVRVLIELPDARCTASVDSMSEVAVAAEELGFWGISVADHLVSDASVATCAGYHDPDGDDRVFYEPLQNLAYVAALTKRIKLLTGVIVLPNRNPVLFAKQIATLDQLSRGRVIVGLGSGALPKRTSDVGFDLKGLGNIARQEYEAYGVRGHRGKLTDEYVAVMENLWMEDRSTFHGETISYNDLEVFPKPYQRPRPPMVWGGRAEAAKRRAALMGEGWIPSQCPLEVFAQGVKDVHQIARDNGHAAPTEFGISVWGSVARTDEAARKAALQAIGRRFESQEALWAGTLVGSPETLLGRIEAYRAVGLNMLILRLVPPTTAHLLAQMRVLAEEVLPALGSRLPVATGA